MNEDWYRNAVAQGVAHTTLIAALLRFELGRHPERAKELGEAIKAQANITDFLTNAAVGDDARAEQLADITVRMQQHVAEIVDNAIDAVERAQF